MRTAIIGAGLAGLAAACDAADAGCSVTLLEKRPWAGGKTYSFADEETGVQIDNGQHIAMRCTTAYASFLERIGSAHLMRWQRRMRVPVLDANGRRSDLAASSLPAPLHVAPSFAIYGNLSLGDKLRIASAIVAMRRLRADSAALDSISFGDWLRAHGQNARTIAGFWDLIIVPALNCRCDDASAAQALFVFREGFLKSAEAGAVGLPRVGLTELHIDPAVRYIEARGGDLRTGASVASIDIEQGRIESLVLASGERIIADAYIAALPPKQLLALLPAPVREVEPFASLAAIRTSPIVNLHLWFERPITSGSQPIIDVDFAAITGNDLQWVFAPDRVTRTEDEAAPPSSSYSEPRTEHLVISLSAADRYMPLDKRALIEMLLPQLHRALPRSASRAIVRSALIKEPEATFVPAPGLRRPGAETKIPNLFLAGAYTDTGWPATMESAVRSGHTAATAALAHIHEQDATSAADDRELQAVK